jgi:hypothetical protein
MACDPSRTGNPAIPICARDRRLCVTALRRVCPYAQLPKKTCAAGWIRQTTRTCPDKGSSRNGAGRCQQPKLASRCPACALAPATPLSVVIRHPEDRRLCVTALRRFCPCSTLCIMRVPRIRQYRAAAHRTLGRPCTEDQAVQQGPVGRREPGRQISTGTRAEHWPESRTAEL